MGDDTIEMRAFPAVWIQSTTKQKKFNIHDLQVANNGTIQIPYTCKSIIKHKTTLESYLKENDKTLYPVWLIQEDIAQLDIYLKDLTEKNKDKSCTMSGGKKTYQKSRKRRLTKKNKTKTTKKNRKYTRKY